MKSLNIMIKPASSLCNMRCRYCFYADIADMRSIRSYGLMKADTAEKILSNIKADLSVGDRVNFVFQGGEPTLAGLDFYRHFTDAASSLEGINVSYALQTNGILLDDGWCELLKKHGFLVGLSLDILPEAHDLARPDEKGDGTYKRVIRAAELLKSRGVDFNVLCTLTNHIARHPEKVWNRIKKSGIGYVQFTPCLGELDGTPSEYALTPERFADFYTRLFGYWHDEYRKGNYISIKLFDDIVNLMIMGRPTSCGMNGACTPQLVIEADGSAYPCDFYCIDGYKLGSLAESTVSELLCSDGAKAFQIRAVERPRLCEKCDYIKFCGGNCPRMRSAICCVGSADYCGYRDFLDRCGTSLAELARESARRMNGHPKA